MLAPGDLDRRPREPAKARYFAGIFHGKALVVGKNYVKGINLISGKEAWPKITNIGSPSGQGAASDNVYYLPLKTGQDKEPEVCAIDIDSGKIVAHTKSRKKEVPGNLVFYQGEVLSQTLTGISGSQLVLNVEGIGQLLAHDAVELLQFLHQIMFGVQSSGGINEQIVCLARLCRRHGVVRHRRRDGSQGREPVAALHFVAEDVDQTRETVDRPEMRAQGPWKEQRCDRKVLRPRAAGYGRDVHVHTFAHVRRRWSNSRASEPP